MQKQASVPFFNATHCRLLEAQQQLFPAELNLARAQWDQLLATVQLYKALGGGWQDETNSAPASLHHRN